MACCPPRTTRLADGRILEVRAAAPGDARAWVDLLRAIDASGPLYAREPGERDTDPARREHVVLERLAADADLLLLAWLEGRAVGYLDLTAHRPRRMAHVAWFHMGVHPDAQRRGVGTALLDAALGWARAHPRLEKVCLGVFSTNAPAIALYRRLGFVEEGRGARAFRLGPGVYADNLDMALFVKPDGPA